MGLCRQARRDGGIGKRNGLKIRRWQHLASSSLAPGTIKIKGLRKRGPFFHAKIPHQIRTKNGFCTTFAPNLYQDWRRYWQQFARVLAAEKQESRREDPALWSAVRPCQLLAVIDALRPYGRRRRRHRAAIVSAWRTGPMVTPVICPLVRVSASGATFSVLQLMLQVFVPQCLGAGAPAARFRKRRQGRGKTVVIRCKPGHPVCFAVTCGICSRFGACCLFFYPLAKFPFWGYIFIKYFP